MVKDGPWPAFAFAHLHGPNDEGQQNVETDDDTIDDEKIEEETEEEKVESI